MTTNTVGAVIDRLFLQYLTPADAQDKMVRLGADITTTTQTEVELGAFAIPEDEALLRSAALIEAELEMMRVVSYDTTTRLITVERNVYSTDAALHTTPLMMTMNPLFPRWLAFAAVADNIIQLHPSLFTARNELLSPTTDRVYAIADDLAVHVEEIWPNGWSYGPGIDGRIVDYHPLTGGRSLLTNVSGSSVWLRYKRRMGIPTDETDLLDKIGVDERWVNIIIAGAAADLLAGRDISAVHSEWIKSVLEAENIRVGTRLSIAGGLRQYRNMLLKDSVKEMKSEYRTKVHMRDPMRMIVR
jgi:hypothetical protein